MPWALSDIRTGVRQVTGRLSSNQLSTNKLDEFINNYYQFTFPAEVKLERVHTFYNFLTEVNTQNYTYPSTFTNFEPPVYVNNIPLLFYQDPTVFAQENPTNITLTAPWTGDGTTTLFSTTVQSFPILPASVLISDGVENFEDTNTTWTTSNVNVMGSGGGTATINYSTGSVSVTFAVAPLDGATINLSYIQFQPGLPTAVLLFNNQFTFYPVPNIPYRVQVKAYSVPTALTSATDTPTLEEWGPAIMYGASRDIVIYYGETDRYAEITQLYKEQISYILTRTVQTLSNERSRPMW
jgi:hypothetical protein